MTFLRVLGEWVDGINKTIHRTSCVSVVYPPLSVGVIRNGKAGEKGCDVAARKRRTDSQI